MIRTSIILMLLLPLTTINTVIKNTDMKAIDTANMNMEVHPGDDFYLYANGGWMEANPLTKEYGRFGTFDILQEENNKKIKSLIKELTEGNHEANSTEYKIGHLYKQGMDTNTIDIQKLDAIIPILEKADKISKAELTSFISELHLIGIRPFFGTSGSPDRKNSDWVIINISQSGLGMNERDYYLENDNRSKELQKAYKEYITKAFIIAGELENMAKDISQDIFSFETELAKINMSKLDRRDPVLTYNKMDIAALSEISTFLQWPEYFKYLNINNTQEININQTDYLKQLDSLIKETSDRIIQNYLKWNIINQSASYLHTELIDAKFEFFGKILSGKEEIRPRWKRIVDITNGSIGEALGQIYVQKHFPPESKERMIKLVENLRISFKNRIHQLEWMSDTTKVEALAKLERIRVKIGYPETWRDFSTLKLNSEYFINNVFEARKFNIEYNLGKIGKPVDPNEWLMLPHTVNAYYHPLHNEIVFPAGILQPPFFYPDADDAVNYGAIGVVIGHEMTHGFDDKGRKFDKEGNLNDWWTNTDEEKFNAKANILVEQFNEILIVDSTYANGKLTLGENIADLGGLQISLDAYKNTDEYKNNLSIDNFTPEQRFFIAYAKVWAQNIRKEEMLRRVKEDVHSLGEHRVNGPLPNLHEFYSAFNISDTNNLYLKESDRAKIW